MLKWHSSFTWLLLIFILAFALRAFNLGSMPLRLHQDEIMNGYVGRYILLNGKDLHGNSWPLLYFDNFGDYPNVLPMYLSGLSTFIFGVNEFAVRFPIALVGALAVFPVFAIMRLVTNDQKTSLFGALTLAILPWHIVLSRATAEHVLGITVYLTALYLLLTALKKEKLRPLLISLPLLALTYFLYASFRIVVPLTLLASSFLASQRLRLALILATLAFFLATGAISSTTWGSGRFKQTSIFSFNSQSNARATNSAYAAGPGRVMLVRLFNNKIVIYTRELVRQYLSYFSFNFLFTDGGHPNRYLVPDQGLLYYSFGLIPVGFLILVFLYPKKVLKSNSPISKRWAIFLIFLLLISPLASALTLDEVPNVHRSALLGVMLLFPIGFAFHHLYRFKLGKLTLVPLIGFLLTLEGVYFLNQYFVQAPRAETVERYDERTDLAKWLIANHDKYGEIYVTREIFPIYYLFYSNNFDPGLAGKFVSPLMIPQVGNVHFVDHNCPSLMREVPSTGKIMVIDKAECDSNHGLIPVGIIQRINATQAYELLVPVEKTK